MDDGTPRESPYVYGDPVTLSDGAETIARCAHCGTPYVPSAHPLDRFCTPRCREAEKSRRRRRDNSSFLTLRKTLKAHDLLTPATRAAIEVLRGVGRLPPVEAWARAGLTRPQAIRAARATAPRASEASDPWALPSPAYPDAWLPGGVVPFAVEGLDRALDVGDGRHLHGLLSALVREDHAQVPGWAVYPVRSMDAAETWAVCWRREAYAQHALKTFDARIGAVPVTVRLGPRHRLRAPPPYAPGVYRVRVTAITPVVIQSHGSARRVTQTAPRADAVARSLAGNLANAVLGAELRHESIPVRVRAEETAPAITTVTRHYDRAAIGGDGRVRGWEGSLVIETNAVGRWLLEVAARGWGLGGRVAMTFGRVRVEDLDATEPVDSPARSVYAVPLSSLSTRAQERLG